MHAQDEVVEDLLKKGQKMEFDNEVVAQVAYTLCDTLCNTWPDELVQLAKLVFVVRLALRISLIENIAGNMTLPARQRKPRKVGNKRNDCEATNILQMDDEISKDASNSSSKENKNIFKLTDFWDQ
ncbi:unnamed protein product [Gongylonema pulchrum]|uniref:Uncharacterized protein n=1 Tax=Gongylonema pulchrum TaxID=637853 RepID=A0A183DA71_9BILA|nr:unnamed protein product [Gongylonema pulchrum]